MITWQDIRHNTMHLICRWRGHKRVPGTWTGPCTGKVWTWVGCERCEHLLEGDLPTFGDFLREATVAVVQLVEADEEVVH